MTELETITVAASKASDELARLRMLRRSMAHDLIADCAHNVAARTGVLVTQMVGRVQRQRVFKARREAMHLARARGVSLREIARYFRRDHSTVMHAVRTHERTK